ncbi:MAG: PRC-barrel domain-containing protein [Firmicutes bacterium]|nr:PRC-barrel domain-containing protein [Bacillota bacterium]
METAAGEHPRSAVLGRKVISINEGMELGQISRVVLTQEPRVTGFIVSRRRGREERVLPLPAVSCYGEDRVTVERQSLLEPVNSFSRHDRGRRGPLILVGSRVFTAGGRVLGQVTEYCFAADDGRVTVLEVSSGPLRERLLLPGEHIIAVSPQTVMIRDAALAAATPAESGLRSGFAAAAGSVGGAVSALAGSTRQGARTVSERLSRLLERSSDHPESEPESGPISAPDGVPESASVEEQDDAVPPP